MFDCHSQYADQQHQQRYTEQQSVYDIRQGAPLTIHLRLRLSGFQA